MLNLRQSFFILACKGHKKVGILLYLLTDFFYVVLKVKTLQLFTTFAATHLTTLQLKKHLAACRYE
jgi:hypothetical protein